MMPTAAFRTFRRSLGRRGLGGKLTVCFQANLIEFALNYLSSAKSGIF